MTLPIPHPSFRAASLFASVCYVLLSMNAIASPIPIESFEGQITPASNQRLIKNGSPSASMAPKLGSDLPGSSSAITLQQVSTIPLRDGSTVHKYTRRLHDIPIVNDWAMMRVSARDQIDSVQYSVTQAKSKLEGVSQRWVLDESAVLERFKTGSTLTPQLSTLKRAWFKRGDTLLPAYTLSAHEVLSGQPALFSLVISATDAALLAKAPLSNDLTAYTYKIYADGAAHLPHQTPYGDVSPHPTGAPSNTPPSGFVVQNEFSILELSTTTTDPWLPDNATETIGNNADVFFNFTRDSNGVFDFFGDGYGPQYRVRGDAADQDFRAPITNGELIFDYSPEDYKDDYHQPFDSASDPTAQQIEAINAQQVQAFYLANLMHDIFYDAGFTESAGNAQTSNYGRGGIEGDPLIVHINSFTFVSTPDDGSSPVIHLGRSRGGSTAFDTAIFAHEWTHYMYRRLVNPNILITDNQSRALNEGWADVVGVLMSMKPSHVDTVNSPGFNSSYSLGGYFTQERRSETFPDPFFYGIRRFPYSSDNPFTFGHIAHKATIPAPPVGSAYSDYNSRATQNSQIHTAGEIWADAVLSCFRDVLLQRTEVDFQSKRALLASYVVSAMANTPPNPTFLEARSALLGAIKLSSETDFQACRFRFAYKGMGSEAIAPPRESKTFAETVESFSLKNLHLSIVSSELSDTISSLDNDGILDQNETGQLILTVQNTGFETIDQAALSLAMPSNDYQVNSGPPTLLTDLAPGQHAEIRLPLRLLHNRHFDLSSFNINITVNGSNPAWERNYLLTRRHRTHYDVDTQVSSTIVSDEFDIRMGGWVLTRQSEQSFVDPQWFETQSANNVVFEIQEPSLPLEGNVRRAWESPWMTASGGSVLLNFDHAFETNSGALYVEISEDGTDWAPFQTLATPYAGTSAGFPGLSAQALNNSALSVGSQFKIRFRTDVYAPLTWQLDNVSISGIEQQPFQEILPEDGIDLNGPCFPIKLATGAVVICL